MFFCGYIRTARYIHVTESPIKIIQYRAKGAMDWHDEEWQHNKLESPGVGSGRISTVIFSLGDKLQWLHVHETWLPEDIVQADDFDF